MEVAPTLVDIKEALSRIAPHIHKTPVLTCSTVNERAGRNVYFKAENFQKIGAFKFRGAMNAILQLSQEQRDLGVVTHSSGNHAQAVALAGKLLGVKTTVIMPSTSPEAKRTAVQGYGAQVIPCGPLPQDREVECQRVVKETGGHFIAPFNDVRVIAGQGTATLEFFEQTENKLEVIVTPLGGGGLLSGTSIAGKGLNPSLIVIGAEPKGADDGFRSFEAGYFIPQTNPNTIADGLRSSLGDITFPIIKNNVTEIITVSDKEIMEAMFLLWERMKIIVEPSGAIGLAAVLSEQFKLTYKETRKKIRKISKKQETR